MAGRSRCWPSRSDRRRRSSPLLFGVLGAALAAASSAQTVSEFPIPTPDALPAGIAVGPDGALWFGEFGSNKIGRITAGGVITEFAIPPPADGPAVGAGLVGRGPDGAIWFVEFYANKIGRITTGGALTEFAVPTPG